MSLTNKKKDLYLISTFRHEWNRGFNPRLAEALEARGFHCYFAHRDTDQTGSAAEIFEQDMAGLSGCKTVLAIAENESPNWGAEVGVAYGRQMPVIALAQINHQIPLIAEGMMSEILRVANLDDIPAYAERLALQLKHHLGRCER